MTVVGLGCVETHFPILEAILSIKPANAQFTGWVGRKKSRSSLNLGFHITKTRSGHDQLLIECKFQFAKNPAFR